MANTPVPIAPYSGNGKRSISPALSHPAVLFILGAGNIVDPAVARKGPFCTLVTFTMVGSNVMLMSQAYNPLLTGGVVELTISATVTSTENVAPIFAVLTRGSTDIVGVVSGDAAPRFGLVTNTHAATKRMRVAYDRLLFTGTPPS
jgi:hypothetical protein